MRLTSVKLAGFKSFVDPVTIPVPGQRVGIVGPNGCGKSNVIDAVRWVLGESSAKQLRGESMQDVIFSGSSTRKPVARASVELNFDNSMGRAHGQWSSYSEIQVRRVLQRNGDSTYYINNLPVRRKDITDLFLGTGVGARAYAIIEQGMISRIIEARPEDLRLYLEEAAGISRYKDRRKETQGRLEDTHENLQRVADIRQELIKQVEHLRAQAEVAAQYKQLQAELSHSQSLLWLARKRDAERDRKRLEKNLRDLTTDNEARLAQLREVETRLSNARVAFDDANQGLHAAQAAVYESNAAVARLEQQMQFLQATRQRLASQIQEQKQYCEQETRNQQQARTLLAELERAQTEVQERVAACRELAENTRLSLPEVETTWRGQRERMQALQKKLSQTEQGWQLEESHSKHSARTVIQLQQRIERLKEEAARLQSVDEDELALQQEALAELELQQEQLRDELTQLEGKLAEQEASARAAQAAVAARVGEMTRLEANWAALNNLQQRSASSADKQNLLRQFGLEQLPRLWQQIQVAEGWEVALEALLGNRLQALAVDDLAHLAQQMGSEAADLALVRHDGRAETFAAKYGFVALGEKLKGSNGPMPAACADWLTGVYCCDSLDAALAMLSELQQGDVLVTPQGHCISRYSVNWYAPSANDGMLARQREIDQLNDALNVARADLPALEQAQQQAARQLQTLRETIQQVRQQGQEIQREAHRQHVEWVRNKEQADRIGQRAGQIDSELNDLAGQLEEERSGQLESEEKAREYQLQLELLQEEFDAAEADLQEMEVAFRKAQAEVTERDRQVQQAEFDERSIISKIIDLKSRIKNLDEILQSARERLEMLEEEALGQDDGALDDSLQDALGRREEREGLLRKAREALDSATLLLQELERERLQVEQSLGPLRDKISEMQLKAQEARLLEQQFAEHLEAAGVNEAELEAPANLKAATLQSEIARLNMAITELGAVNLAALEELKAAEERDHYLQAQAADLTEAMQTLEDAIRRIDRETRERLMETFNTVNGHLSRLFPELFGGGEAKLILTGEEILDSGVQIMAQPPGKKNSSIHLLSGGEKALTALSLVFAMFQLNPAPFCLLDEVDAPLDDSNTERYANLVSKMSEHTQFLFITHNKIAMYMAEHLVGVTMQESGCSRVVAVDVAEAVRLAEASA